MQLLNSQKIKSLFPEFVQENNPLIFNFLQYYYEALEQPFGSLDLVYNLLDYYTISYYKPSNLVKNTTLASNISETTTNIQVKSTFGFPNSGYLQIDDEIIYYTSKTSTIFENCFRGTSTLLLKDDKTNTLTLTSSNSSIHNANSIVTNIAFGFANRFLKRIKDEILIDFPDELVYSLNFANLLGNIKQFYQNKGNIESTNFLFKLLFNDIRVKLLIVVGVGSDAFNFIVGNSISTSTGTGIIENVNTVTNELILNNIIGEFTKGQSFLLGGGFDYSIAEVYPDSAVNKSNAASIEIIPYNITRSLPKTQVATSSNELYYKKNILKIYAPNLSINLEKPFSISQTGDTLLNLSGDTINSSSIVNLGNSIYEIECDVNNLYPIFCSRVKVSESNLITNFNISVESANGFPTSGILLVNNIGVTYTDRTSNRLLGCTATSSLNINVGDIVYCIARDNNTPYYAKIIQGNIEDIAFILPLLNNLNNSSFGSLYNTNLFKISKSNFSTELKSNKLLCSFENLSYQYNFDSRNIQSGITGIYQYNNYYYFSFDGGLDYSPTYTGRILDFINQKYIKRIRKSAGVIIDTEDEILPTKAIGFTVNGSLILANSGNSYTDSSNITWHFNNHYYLPLDSYGGYQYNIIDSTTINIENESLSIAPITLDNLPASFENKEYLLLNPSSLYLTDYDTSSGHSKILGWSFDGHPIYGRRGYTDPFDSDSVVIDMTSGYELNTTRLSSGASIGNVPLGGFIEDYTFTDVGTLDSSNGRYCITPEFPNGIYAYFITEEYPYIIGNTYKSKLDSYNINISRTNDNIPSFYRKLLPENFSILDSNTTNSVCFSADRRVGTISSVYIEDGGEDYEVYDKLIVDNSGTDGRGFDAYVQEVDVNGSILKIKVSNSGNNYSKLPTVTNIGSNGNGAIIQLESNTINSLQNINTLSSDFVISDYTVDYQINFNYILRVINNFTENIRNSLDVESEITTRTSTSIIKFCDSVNSILEVELISGYFSIGDEISFDGNVYGIIRSFDKAEATLTPSSYSKIQPQKLNTNSNLSYQYTRLLDSNYYQDYSYQINNTHNYIEYASPILKNLHPVGFKLFANKLIDSKLSYKNLLSNSTFTNNTELVDVEINIESRIFTSLCNNCLELSGITVNPSGSPVTWSQISGREITFDDINSISPIVCGISDNQINTEEIVLQITSGESSELLSIFSRPTDTIQTKYSQIQEDSYSLTNAVDINLLFTAIPSGTEIPINNFIQLPTSFTFNEPIDNTFIVRYGLLRNSTGSYIQIEETDSLEKILTVPSLPDFYKIRAYFNSNGGEYFKDSIVRYLTEDDFGLIYGTADSVISKYSYNSINNQTIVPYVFSNSLIPINEQDTLISKYSKITDNNTTEVFYVYNSSLVVIDNNYDPQLNEDIITKYSTVYDNNISSNAYIYNRGGLVIG